MTAVTPPTLAMIAVGLVAETVSLRSALRHARDTRPSDETLRVHLRTSRDPDDTIVVVEDVGALAGLSIALLGIGMAAITGSPTWDSVATLLIGLLLCGLAAFLTVQMHALLVGEPARPTDLAAIRQAVVGTDGVGRILNLRTEHLGPEDLLVCVKVALADVTTVDRALAVIDDVDRRVAAAVPHTLVTYVELDRYDPDRAGGPWT